MNAKNKKHIKLSKKENKQNSDKHNKTNQNKNNQDKNKKDKIIMKKDPVPISVHKFKEWEIMQYKKISINKPILIAGMPGIGNVGKISMDVVIEEIKAELFMKFFSYDLPNSVFVNENNLVDLPKIEMYYKKINNQDFLFLTGDVQPSEEKASYELSELIIDFAKQNNISFIMTLGGIGLAQIPEVPKVYMTGNSKEFIDKISKEFQNKKLAVETKIYGIVGPIMGLSGILLGMAKKDKINACALLAETFGHPIYIGLKGSKAILNILNTNFKLGMKFDKLEKEIKQIDAQIKGLQGDATNMQTKYKKLSEVNYIG